MTDTKEICPICGEEMEKKTKKNPKITDKYTEYWMCPSCMYVLPIFDKKD